MLPALLSNYLCKKLLLGRVKTKHHFYGKTNFMSSCRVNVCRHEVTVLVCGQLSHSSKSSSEVAYNGYQLADNNPEKYK